jgi:autotransporter-associated beta strand protein
MTPEQVKISGSALNLQAIAQRHPSAPGTVTSGGNTYSLDYTSGAIHTNGKLNVTHGYLEARMKMPNVKGVWPAFWTLQNGWPPEIDIMEFPLSQDNQKWRYWANYHYGPDWTQHRSYGSELWQSPDLTAGFHDYAVEWTPSYLRFFFDGVQKFQVTDAAAIAQLANNYLILNHAVGGWPGNPPSNSAFPANFETEWVRVWQKPAGGVMSSTWTKAAAGNQNWHDNANWSAGAPVLGSQTARLSNVAAADVRLDWVRNITLGQIDFDAATNYTVGWPDDSLMMANQSGRALINVFSAGPHGRHAVSSRLEVYNNISIRNYNANPFNVNGDVVGQGELALEYGKINLNGRLSHSGHTVVNHAADVTLTGQLNTPDSDLNLSTAAGSTAAFRIAGTASATVKTLRVGGSGGAAGILVQTGGTMNTTDWFVVGQSGSASGTVSMTAGTLNVRTVGSSGDLELGVFDNSRGDMTVSGSANVKLLNNAWLVLGSHGTAGSSTFNQDGGAVTFYADAGTSTASTGQLVLGRNNSTGVNTYNLNGGTLTIPRITRASGTGVFNFNGGTLKPTADSISFLQSLTAAYVKAGGAVVDTNGKNITFAQPLLSGDEGSGLIKRGLGALTLTGGNTYTGTTEVQQGTLVVQGSVASVNVLAAARLTGNVTIRGALATSGEIAPGNTAGPISTVSAASAAFNAGSKLSLELSPTSHDRLAITGAAEIQPGSTLALSTLNNYQPAGGQAFDVLTYASLTGEFSTYTGATLASGLVLAPFYLADRLRLFATYPGDATGDGTVSFADFQTLELNFNQPGTWSDGDFNLNGTIDHADFLALRQNFGLSLPVPSSVESPGAIVPVPEPTTPLIAGLALLALTRRRRGHLRWPRLTLSDRARRGEQ